MEESADVRCMDAFRFLRESAEGFDLIYIAPPQYRGLWIKAIEAVDERPALLKDGGRVIVQVDPREYKQFPLQKLSEERQRRYGNTLLVFYGLKSDDAEAPRAGEDGGE